MPRIEHVARHHLQRRALTIHAFRAAVGGEPLPMRGSAALHAWRPKSRRLG